MTRRLALTIGIATGLILYWPLRLAAWIVCVAARGRDWKNQ